MVGIVTIHRLFQFQIDVQSVHVGFGRNDTFAGIAKPARYLFARMGIVHPIKEQRIDGFARRARLRCACIQSAFVQLDTRTVHLSVDLFKTEIAIHVLDNKLFQLPPDGVSCFLTGVNHHRFHAPLRITAHEVADSVTLVLQTVVFLVSELFPQPFKRRGVVGFHLLRVQHPRPEHFCRRFTHFYILSLIVIQEGLRHGLHKCSDIGIGEVRQIHVVACFM